jgi:hypothetical protein
MCHGKFGFEDEDPGVVALHNNKYVRRCNTNAHGTWSNRRCNDWGMEGMEIGLVYLFMGALMVWAPATLAFLTWRAHLFIDPIFLLAFY